MIKSASLCPTIKSPNNKTRIKLLKRKERTIGAPSKECGIPYLAKELSNQTNLLTSGHTKIRKSTKRREKTRKDTKRREKTRKDTPRDIIQCEKTSINLDLGVFSCFFACEVQYSVMILVVKKVSISLLVHFPFQMIKVGSSGYYSKLNKIICC